MESASYTPLERRPIASRDSTWAQATAAWLAARGASPNGISVAGMVAAIVAGVCLYFTNLGGWEARVLWIAAALLAQCRLLANLFDGMVAIRRNVASPVGELYNEVPDRISDAAIFIGLGYAAGGWPVLGWAAALVAVFTAYVRAAAKVAGAPQDYCGPMAKPQRMFVVTVTAVYCALTPISWQAVKSNDVALGAAGLALMVVAAGGLITAVRRLLRAAAFLKRKTS